MLIYIIKSTSILALLLLFYKLILEKERIHIFKRFFLLTSVLLAIGIPAITFTTYIETSAAIEPMLLENNIELTQERANINYLQIGLWSLYGLGVLFFGIRFLVNLSRLFDKIRSNEKVKSNQFVYVLIHSLTTPHTFFKYIFFDKNHYKAKLIRKEVIIHEQAHASQLHSFDVLCIELLQIIFWFNPFIYLLKNNVKLNHEFLADEAVLKAGVKLKEYQHILLEHSFTDNNYPLANAINYASIKKRFKIMKTKTPSRNSWLKSTLLLPLLAVLIFGFSEKAIIQQDKASPEQVTEYNQIAKKYNEMSSDRFIVKIKEVERLKYIYSIMNKTQKKSAESFPNFPPPPLAPKRVYKGEEQNNIPPPPVRKVVQGSAIKDIPPPPIPPNPLDHVIELAKKGATFYNEDKKISSDRAIDIVKNNSNINIQVRNHDSNNPIVNLSKKPIVVKGKLDPKWSSSYNNYMGEMYNKGADFYFEGEKVSLDQVLKIKQEYGKINMLTQDVDTKKPLVVLSRKEITKKNLESIDR